VFPVVLVLGLSSKFCVKMAVCWGAAPCGVVEITLIVDAVSTSETSVNFYQTTLRKIPADNQLDARTTALLTR
jgi:hypothetical protein